MRIGTRGSALALVQAGWVAQRLGDDVELVKITTSGDGAQPITDKSRWVSGLELALLEGRIDLAVHSAKDLPADLAEGLSLVAIPAREDARDAICGAASIAELPGGARVGTSSLRRAAQLRSVRDDIEVVPLRGNVDTRLRKLADGDADALVLALAGLRRLGREDAAGGVLEELLPAAGQGALALEARDGDPIAELAAGLDDAQASACVSAERELTRALGASCNTAVGAYARCLEGGLIELRGWVGAPDGSAWVADRLVGVPLGLGHEVAARLLAVGAAELLREAERVWSGSEGGAGAAATQGGG